MKTTVILSFIFFGSIVSANPNRISESRWREIGSLISQAEQVYIDSEGGARLQALEPKWETGRFDPNQSFGYVIKFEPRQNKRTASDYPSSSSALSVSRWAQKGAKVLERLTRRQSSCKLTLSVSPRSAFMDCKNIPGIDSQQRSRAYAFHGRIKNIVDGVLVVESIGHQSEGENFYISLGTPSEQSPEALSDENRNWISVQR